MKTTEITDLNSLPANAIVVYYSDHYWANSGDSIALTDQNGNFASGHDKPLLRAWNEYPDDRGVIKARAVTHANGAFAALVEFRHICQRYITYSKALKDWDKGEQVYNLQLPSTNNFRGMKQTGKFEETMWFRRYSSQSKPATVEKRREKFEIDKQFYNESSRNAIQIEKEKAAEWFIENKISTRIAYLFLNGYYL